MAVKSKVKTLAGENRECYTRLNSLQAWNHGLPVKALFRSYLSEAAFTDGAHYVAEFDVEFEADVSKPLWPQAYAALTAQEKMGKGKEV